MSVGSVGTISDARRRALQRGAHRLLDEILSLGVEGDLPVIDWQVSQYAVVGTMNMIPNERRRDVFCAWVTALGLDQWADSPRAGGWVHLHAFTEDWRGSRVNVAVMADVDTEEPP